MTRTVFCKRLRKELPGLEAPPFPGPRGRDIYEQVSQEAWNAWQKHQTILINERQLNMMDKEARTFLNDQMERFFNGEELVRAEGYVPPVDTGPNRS